MPATGESREDIMSKKTDKTSIHFADDAAVYTDAPAEVEEAFERSMRIPDFLPTPAELKGEAKKQKVTIMLDTHVVEFFKAAAKEYGGHYQTMVNNLLVHYVAAQTQPPRTRDLQCNQQK